MTGQTSAGASVPALLLSTEKVTASHRSRVTSRSEVFGDISHRAHARAGGGASTIDELLDRAVAAINRGDRVAASSLAQQVLAADKET